MTNHSGDSCWDPAPTHPVLEFARQVSDALAQIEGVDPLWMPAAAKAEALRTLDRLRVRMTAVELAVLARAEDVAADGGARSPAAWLSGQTHRDYGTCAAHQRLGEGLVRWGRLGEAVSAGTFNLDQAKVVIAALDALPADLVPPELLEKAEAHLVTEGARFTPRQLKALGERLLAILAPDVLEEAERRAIEAEMERARQRTRLGVRSNGDGTSTLTAVLPDSAVERLMVCLDALTSPRTEAQAQARKPDRGSGVTDPATGRWRPADQVRGHAFCALLERMDPATLPQHGGTATTVMVTISLDELREGLGTADLVTGGTISAGDPSTRLPGRDRPGGAGRQQRDPRPWPEPTTVQPRAAQGDGPQGPRVPCRGLHDPRSLVRGAPRGASLVTGWEDRSRRRRPALLVAPPSRS